MTPEPNQRDRIEINRRKFLKTASVTGVGVGGVTAFSGGAAASHPPGCDVLVDPGNTHADASTIQGGVNTAGSGQTVCVAEDTYDEQVVISQDLTLESVPGDSPVLSWTANAGTDYSANSWLVVDGGASVTLTGLTFEGPFPGSNTAGIFVTGGAELDASGLTMNQMYNPSNGGISGSQSHGGIAVGDHRFGSSPSNGTLNLSDSMVNEFGKFAVSSVGGDSSVEINNVDINGSGTLGPGVGKSGPAQDTILVDGGNIVVKNSMVDNVSYVNGFVAGTAVSVFGPSDHIVIEDNEFTDVAKSISFQSNRSFDPTGGTIEGAVVKNNDVDVWRGGDPPVDSTTEASFGLEVFIGDGGPSDVVLRDSEVSGNSFYNGRGVGIHGSTENVDFSDNTFRDNTQHVWQNSEIDNFGRWLSSWVSDNTFDKKFVTPPDTILHGENPHRN